MDEQQRENGIDPQNITIIARILQQIVHLNVSDNNLNILGPASNILDIRNTKSWRNMTDNKVIRDLVITLEDYGLQYGENLKNSSNTSLIVKDYPNVQLNLRYIKYAGNLSREERIFKFPNASFNLSPDALLKESGAVVVILWYKTIHYLIKNTSSGDNIYAAISSKIITVNVRPERKVKFSEPVRISWDLAELNDFKMCAYWKPRLGENIWKSDGCKRITDKLYSNRLTCECDHLTAFAVMDISRTMLSKDKRKALELISTIGCSVSLVGVILTILIYALFWKRLHSNSKSKVPSQVLMHLCVVIGMTDIFAILAGPALKYKTFCIAVSVLLYFFVLALFGWMLCEGIIIYLQLVKVFSGLGLGGKHLKGFYIIGWGKQH
ncbi:adhesion G -coupled receptor L2-like [Paramuricea clavata]|uniref:Adhesion G -coupled receptor L2-like n=1 Tax=Paramuricea clavata TaxID=317549 RepID=A0A7D9IWP6_PARCT|nr:adhesion G -coupled receptor L2-like [Paramuricea clavata]